MIFGEKWLQRLKDKYNEMSFESLAAKRDINLKMLLGFKMV